MSKSPPPLTYRDSGVDIARGNAFVRGVKPLAASTRRPGVLGGLGGFGALFELPVDRYTRPILVSGTDGVGTKLRLAIDAGIHDTVGIDLVAMCVNDILTIGAEPLFFLDYYATGRLDTEVALAVVAGIAKGCRLSGAALVGGETAEMPGIYHGDDYDLAGFCVGVVEHDAMIDGRAVKPGDQLIALASSGVHSNGFSLVRKSMERSQVTLSDLVDNQTLGEHLLIPTRIYVKSVAELTGNMSIHAMAHVTGGGLVENIPRMLPEHTQAVIDVSSWKLPTIFEWLQRETAINDTEMMTTFNCGIGFVLCVAAEDCDTALSQLRANGESAWRVGEVAASTDATPSVTFST